MRKYRVNESEDTHNISKEICVKEEISLMNKERNKTENVGTKKKACSKAY